MYSTIWSRSFVILFFSNIALNLGLNMSNTLIPLFADHLGAAAAAIGVVGSAFTISAMLFRIVSAPIMDTYNRKYLVILTALLLAAAFLGFSISDSIPMLIGFRLVQGCGMAFGNSCCLAMAASLLPKDSYNSGIGLFSLAHVMSMALGPTFALELLRLTGFSMTFSLIACLLLLASILACLIKTDFIRSKRLVITFRNIIATESLAPVSIQLLIMVGSAAINSFLILFSREQNISGNISLYFTVSAITLLFTRPIFGRLTDKFGMRLIAYPAIVCNLLSFIMISRSTTLIDFLAAAILSSLGQGAINPMIQVLAMKSVSQERRGAASSTVYLASDFGFLFGNLLAGHIVQAFSYVLMWRIMVVPSVMSALILFFFSNKFTHIEEEFASR